MTNWEITKRKLAALALIGALSLAPAAFAGGDGYGSIHCSQRACGGRHGYHKVYCWHPASLGGSWGYPWYTGYEDYGYADYGYSYPNPYYTHLCYRYYHWHRNGMGCGSHGDYRGRRGYYKGRVYHTSSGPGYHDTGRAYHRR